MVRSSQKNTKAGNTMKKNKKIESIHPQSSQQIEGLINEPQVNEILNNLSKEDLIRVIANIADAIQDFNGWGFNTVSEDIMKTVGVECIDFCKKKNNWDWPLIDCLISKKEEASYVKILFKNINTFYDTNEFVGKVFKIKKLSFYGYYVLDKSGKIQKPYQRIFASDCIAVNPGS